MFVRPPSTRPQHPCCFSRFLRYPHVVDHPQSERASRPARHRGRSTTPHVVDHPQSRRAAPTRRHRGRSTTSAPEAARASARGRPTLGPGGGTSGRRGQERGPQRCEPGPLNVAGREAEGAHSWRRASWSGPAATPGFSGSVIVAVTAARLRRSSWLAPNTTRRRREAEKAEQEAAAAADAPKQKSVGERLRAAAQNLRGKKDAKGDASRTKASKPARGAAKKSTTPRKAGGS